MVMMVRQGHLRQQWVKVEYLVSLEYLGASAVMTGATGVSGMMSLVMMGAGVLMLVILVEMVNCQ